MPTSEIKNNSSSVAVASDKLAVSVSPHVTSHSTTRRIMRDVLIALAPVCLAAIYFFGYMVIINIVVCVIACAGFELLYDLIRTKQFSKDGIKQSSIFNLSCVVTAIILALNLPASLQDDKGKDVWGLAIFANNRLILDIDMIIICVIGSLFAIVVAKMLFGGIGKNFANPAIAGRIFLFLSLGSLTISAAKPLFGLDATSGATWLGVADHITENANFGNMFWGYHASAAVGETSIIAILIGFAYLSVRRVIDFRLPLIILGSAVVFAFLFDVVAQGELAAASPARIFNKTFTHLLAGGLVFGAVFMATDYSSSPNTFVGQVVFGVGIAFFTMLIRVFTSLPEGMSFAILIMNVATPLIDKYIYPKPFGFKKSLPSPALASK